LHQTCDQLDFILLQSDFFAGDHRISFHEAKRTAKLLKQLSLPVVQTTKLFAGAFENMKGF